MIESIVYALCAATALACAVLLFRGYGRTGFRLLFWTGWFFVGLVLGNGLLLLESTVLSAVDLALIRTLPAVLGIAVLLYGLVWEGER